MTTPTKLLGAFAVAAATVLLPLDGADAGVIGPPSDTLLSEPTFDREAPGFTFEPDGAEPTCDSPVVTVQGPDGALDPADVVDFDTPLSGTFLPGDAPAGFYDLSILCEDGEFTQTYSASFAYGRLTVTKVVEGDAPPSASFTIQVDCDGGDPEDSETFVEERQFGAEGGEAAVIIYEGTVCTTTETDDGGADSATVEGGTADFREAPVDLDATVTNVFDASAPAPTPTPTPTPAPTPGAQPVVAQPTFTG
jgi:hypothetical protein